MNHILEYATRIGPIEESTKAVLYCRVSSNAQLRKGDGLGSQETRCRQYAQSKGFEVVNVFLDEGASGGMIDRPGMRAMLQFLKAQKQRSIYRSH